MPHLLPPERIESMILLLRGQKVILDSDLAILYNVPTGSLIQAVKRNKERFPEDFLFQLTPTEFENLISQFVISSSKHGGRRHPPYAFTEQGVAMLSSVLRSKRAMHVNISIMRTFVRLRQFLSSHAELASKLEDLERKYMEHDRHISAVFDAIRQLMNPPSPENDRKIGFRLE